MLGIRSEAGLAGKTWGFFRLCGINAGTLATELLNRPIPTAPLRHNSSILSSVPGVGICRGQAKGGSNRRPLT